MWNCRAGRIDADNAARSRSRSRRTNGVLEDVHPIARIEGDPDNRREPVRPLLDLSAWCDLPNLRHVRANRKRIEVADEEIAMQGDFIGTTLDALPSPSREPRNKATGTSSSRGFNRSGFGHRKSVLFRVIRDLFDPRPSVKPAP